MCTLKPSHGLPFLLHEDTFRLKQNNRPMIHRRIPVHVPKSRAFPSSYRHFCFLHSITCNRIGIESGISRCKNGKHTHTMIEAMNAFITKNKNFILNSQILLRVLQ
ncbi:hypothetical protein O6P43_006736 [Quillaja saponaria]|uniref:Uncharacterized protein n=1 Tax=Quillaja saponaria TaxID=32244 RepID=A0AAD7Q8V6_QUISA|nr:hypothetical protein O6P43_006736 [Quillaja saponaria]